jgi:4-methylaminobutanoate oxidase (formaldehyde-forming)
VGLAYARGAAARRQHAGTPVELELWGRKVPATAWDRWTPR